jgi:hypothetical protein
MVDGILYNHSVSTQNFDLARTLNNDAGEQSSELGSSRTSNEPHLTIRVFGDHTVGLTYLGGIHAYPITLGRSATFQTHENDARNSKWRGRTVREMSHRLKLRGYRDFIFEMNA